MRSLGRLEKQEKRLEEIETVLSDPEALKDRNKYQKITQELSRIRPLVEKFRSYKRAQKEIDGLEEALGKTSEDSEMNDLIKEEIKTLLKKQKESEADLENELLQESGSDCAKDVIIEIRAGTGGEEAALFAADLFRMYTQYAMANGQKTEIIGTSQTGIGGFKEIIFSVSGKMANSKFKFESGIHRVQRVPKTESSGRIHTSAVTVAVMTEAGEEDVEILPKELRIDVFRASGAGGQHVNKTESAVRITHFPTGTVVSCQDDRSQHKNKAKAMRVLRARVFEAKKKKKQEEESKARKALIGSGDRSGKIRTYNFPDQRVTDHRIGLTLHSLDDILNGQLDPIVQALMEDEKERKLADAA